MRALSSGARWGRRILLLAGIAAAGRPTRVSDGVIDASPRKPAQALQAVDRAPAASAIGRSSTPAALAGKTLWPAAGERWIFRFERKAAAEREGRTWLSLALGGLASVERIGSIGTNALFLLSFEIDRMEMQGKPLAERRSLPFARVEVSPEGRVRELRWAKLASRESTVDSESEDAVRDLVAQWLFFEPENRLGRAEIEIQDLGGSRAARTYSKRVVRYPERPEIQRLDSEHEWRASAGADGVWRVERLEGSESFSVGSEKGALDQRATYVWVRTETAAVARAIDVSVGGPFGVADAQAATVPRANRPAMTRAELDAFWPRIAAVTAPERLRFFEYARRALAVGSAGLVEAVVAGVRGHAASSIEWRTGIGLLAATSNPEAQAALHALYLEPGRRTEEKLSILAGVAAGEGKPDPLWKETFSRELENKTASSAVREASLYALGSAIRKETDEERKRELSSELSNEAARAESVADRVAVLEAIGNSADTAQLPYVRSQFAAPDPRVRAKAVFALRFFPSEDARPILDIARTDPSAGVRRAAERSGEFLGE